MDNFSFENKPRNGPFKKTSDRDNRTLIWHAFTNPKDTLFAFAMLLKLSHKFGCNTVQKILKAYGKIKRKPSWKPYLKPKYKQKWLIWCK